jgi:hypothetical protein
VASFKCEHSGGSWLKGHIYTDKNDPNSAEPGVGVVIGGAGGDKYQGPNLSDGNGDFAYVLSGDNLPPYKGTLYAWLVNSTGNRISDMAGPFDFNGKNENFVDSCWGGWAFFTKNF